LVALADGFIVGALVDVIPSSGADELGPKEMLGAALRFIVGALVDVVSSSGADKLGAKEMLGAALCFIVGLPDGFIVGVWAIQRVDTLATPMPMRAEHSSFMVMMIVVVCKWLLGDL
jgi:hypothetical protein